MIKILITVICITGLAFAGCKFSGTDGTYNVSGKFTDATSTGSYIYLKEVNYAFNQQVRLDSQKIGPDGTFKFSAHPNGLRIYKLFINKESPLIVINDERNVRINIRQAGLLHADIEGSAATTRLRDFINDFNVKESLLKASVSALDSIAALPVADPATDSFQQTLSEQMKAQNAGIRASAAAFVESNDEPAGIYYALNNLAARVLDAKEMSKLAKSAAIRFKTDQSLVNLSYSLDMAAADSGYFLFNKPAPDLVMQSIDDKPMKISDFSGKYLLVDFWASWCGPCRAENPNVVRVYHKFKDENFTILGVSLDQNKSLWVSAVQKDQLEWNHMSDLKQWQSDAIKAYKLKGIPFNVLIDPNGKVIASNLRGEALEKKLDEIFKHK